MERHFFFFAFFYHHDLAMLCVYLTLIVQYSDIPCSSTFTPSCCCSIYILKLKFRLLETNGRPDMPTREELNEKFI